MSANILGALDALLRPPDLTRVTAARWCLSVGDQVANDQILGTGAHKRGLSGTVYRPVVDAGWGATTGVQDGYEGAVRGYYPNAQDLAVILARIKTVRAGGTFATDTEATPRRDALDDVIRVFAYAGRPGLHWTVLAQLLAEKVPEAYAGLSADVLSATLRDAGVPSVDVKVDGVNLKGCRREAVDSAIQQRSITDGR